MRLSFWVCSFTTLLAGCGTDIAPLGTGKPPIPPDVTQSEILSLADLQLLHASLVNSYVVPFAQTDPDLAYTLVAGFQPDVGVRTAAALDDLIVLGTARDISRANLVGTFHILAVENIAVVNEELIGRTTQLEGEIELSADFDTMTLTGGSEGDVGATIIVNAQIANNALIGTVTFEGQEGVLDGKVSQNRAVAVFHGNSDTTAFVGGFDASAADTTD